MLATLGQRAFRFRSHFQNGVIQLKEHVFHKSRNLHSVNSLHRTPYLTKVKPHSYSTLQTQTKDSQESQPEHTHTTGETQTKTPQFMSAPSPRNQSFKALDESDITSLKSFVSDPNTQFYDSYDDVLPYCTDWTGVYRSSSLNNDISGQGPTSRNKQVVIFPNTTQQISNILKYCNDNNIAVTPQAGNTGLVWGSIPIHDELIVNISKMNSIIKFDPLSAVLTCEAGCTVQQINDYLASLSPSHMLPYDLGSKGSCEIGGNVSTNAGGLRLIRYGNLSGSVFGLEVVLADGTVLDALNVLKKDNTGLKLHQVFIGAEGTLGIVTKVSILCPFAPKSVQTCLLHLSSFKEALDVVMKFKNEFSDIIAAAEFFDSNSFYSVLKAIPSAYDLFNPGNKDVDYPTLSNDTNPVKNFYVILETHSQSDKYDKARLSEFMEKMLDNEVIQNAILAENESQRSEMWALREQISPSLNHYGKVHKFDLTFSFGDMYNIITDTRTKIEQSGTVSPSDVFVVGYGHVGDGNIHLNVICKNDETYHKVYKIINPWVYEYTAAKGGSISAEHGIGANKLKILPLVKDEDYINFLKELKFSFDPKGILNPYKLIPTN